MKKRILVAEDEAAIREVIVFNLERSGYEVIAAENGAKAMEAYNSVSGDVAIALLDIMMPERDGLSVCKEIRETNKSMGIIMLTAKTQEMDKVKGLSIGADDYVTKPFSMSELIARVDALYRRLESIDVPVCDYILTSGEFCLNLRNHSLTKNGEPIELTLIEFKLMEYFFNNQGAALNREDILEHVYGENFFGEDKVVDVNIRRLRVKIEEQPSSPKHLITIYGHGYKWV